MYRHDGRHDSRYVAGNGTYCLTIAVCTAEYVARGVASFSTQYYTMWYTIPCRYVVTVDKRTLVCCYL